MNTIKATIVRCLQGANGYSLPAQRRSSSHLSYPSLTLEMVSLTTADASAKPLAAQMLLDQCAIELTPVQTACAQTRVGRD